MAGLGFLNTLGGLGRGYYEGQDDLLRRQMLRQQLQSQQAQEQGLGALANAYASMGQGQQAPQRMPTPPMPGQPSQPQQQGPTPPQAMMPPPPQGGAMSRRMMGPPGDQMQAPPQAPAIRPYTEPRPPQPQQPPQGMAQLPPPPSPQVQQAVQSTLPDLETMADTLKKQGVTGMALFSALQQHQQFLSADGKRELAMLTAELNRMKAGGALANAQTKARAEDRLEAGAAGETAFSKAKIGLMDAQAKAALIRANKAGTANVSPEDFAILSKAVADGQVDPASLSTKGGLREKVLMGALKANPDYDQKNYQADKAFETSGSRTAGTAGANTAIAARAAEGGAEIMEKLSDKVPRGKWRSLNELILKGKTESNDPDVGAFLTSINTFVNEYARSVNPKGTATVSDKEHARELLSASDSPEAFKAKVSVMRQEMARGRQAPQDVEKDLRANRGRNPSLTTQDKQAKAWADAHPDDPRAKQILQRLGM